MKVAAILNFEFFFFFQIQLMILLMVNLAANLENPTDLIKFS